MCLARVYKNDDNSEENLVMESVTFLGQENGEVKMTSLFNEQKSLPGVIKSINFNGSVVTIATE